MRIRTLGTVVAVAMLVLAGCGSSSKNRPAAKSVDQSQGQSSGKSAWVPAGAAVHGDVAYGDDPAQKLDVYQGSKAKDAPIIIMVHGGG